MSNVLFDNMAQNALSAGQAKGLPKIPKNADIRLMRQKAEDFEAVFIGQMLRPMFAGLKTDGPFSGGPGEDMWRSLQVDEYGKAIAKSGGIGIADAVMRQMLKAQEAKHETPQEGK